MGGSQSESETKQRSSTSKGSTLQAGGNVNLIATGGGEDSNILVRGSDIKAGNNLLLAADNNITLEAAQDTFEQHSTSKSKSAAIGVASRQQPAAGRRQQHHLGGSAGHLRAAQHQQEQKRGDRRGGHLRPRRNGRRYHRQCQRLAWQGGR
ncbi:hemagglutinin repeat-containing protein [Xanthomonas dyei]|uniref:hemagglutinin repeat-containing protein n=1 Tax=Xanthomonas dyei TaxID=743699 RepID=UPI003D1833B3